MNEGLELILVWQAERIRQLEAKVYTDTLTKIGNRAAFDQAISLAWDAWQQGGQESALLYLDGNGIKAINDSLGHDVGDRFIEAIANSIRCYDQAFRLGGDEFAVIVSATRGDMPTIVQRIHHRVFIAEQQLRAQLGNQARLSTAIGWAMTSSVNTLEQLKHQADSHMYAQKSAYKQFVLQLA